MWRNSPLPDFHTRPRCSTRAEHERWAVTARCERGYTELLPDLAVWLKRSEPPVAVVAESGGRREDRQKMILEGWRDAILSGRYSGVHYHCASASVAHWIRRLAKKVWLTGPAFFAAAQMSAEEIAALPPPPTTMTNRPSASPGTPLKPHSRATSTSRLQPLARRRPRRRRRSSIRSHRRSSSPKHPRRSLSESASTARSSAYPSQRCAAHGDAELGADVPTTCWTGVDVEIPGGDRGCGTSSMPSSVGIHANGRHLSQTASNPPKQDNNPRCVALSSLAQRSRCWRRAGARAAARPRPAFVLARA